MRMRFLWVDAGNDPDWAKVSREGMTGLFFPLLDDTRDIVRRLNDTKARGLIGGVYGCWNWNQGYTETDGAGFAEWVDRRLKELVAAGLVLSARSPRVQLNNERHERAVILAMLRRWRELRPKHSTSWTMEGGQGGWMGPIVSGSTPPSDFVTEVISHRVRLVPQLYNGAMTETWDPLTYTRDLTRRGFPEALVSPFYDAGALDAFRGWEGFAFTMGRIR